MISSNLWDIKITVNPSLTKFFIILNNLLISSGVRTEVGSSMIRIFGLFNNDLTISTDCL